MPANPVVRARIDERTKKEAAAALKKTGPTVPNSETVAAMKAARRGELIHAGPPDDLLRSLNAGD